MCTETVRWPVQISEMKSSQKICAIVWPFKKKCFASRRAARFTGSRFRGCEGSADENGLRIIWISTFTDWFS